MSICMSIIMANCQIVNGYEMLLHALKKLPFHFTPVTHMVYLEIRLHYLDFAIEKLTSSNWISKYTMCVTGVNWKVTFLSACNTISGRKFKEFVQTALNKRMIDILIDKDLHVPAIPEIVKIFENLEKCIIQ